MKANVYDLDGKVKKKITLPKIFDGEIRPDLIKTAVLSSQSGRYQPHGTNWLSGKNTSAYSYGPGHSVSRVPRIKGSRHQAGGAGAIVPQAVGGRVAHPPKVEKKIVKRINTKEKKKAVSSTIAATAIKELVAKRGHVLDGVKEIPLIITDDFEKVKTAKETKEIFTKLGVWDDVLRAKEKKIRAGKGKKRGRKYKRKKSAIIVISKDEGIRGGAGNHPGIDIVQANNLGAEDLAPGTHYGRLAIYTEGALKVLEDRFK